jgi:hypothetical protein
VAKERPGSRLPGPRGIIGIGRSPEGSYVFRDSGAVAARGSISYRELASHPDSRCHKIVTTHGPVAKDAGKALGTPWRGSAADFENAVVEHRRCRLQRSSWNQVNGASRADDIVHETEGMRSNATAASRGTPCLRDHRMRHGEKILVVEDSLPAGRNDRRFAARLRPGAGRSGRQAGARTPAGPRPRDRRRGFVLRSAPGERSHPELSPRQNALPTTVTREERFAADVRLRSSHRAWRDK